MEDNQGKRELQALKKKVKLMSVKLGLRTWTGKRLHPPEEVDETRKAELLELEEAIAQLRTLKTTRLQLMLRSGVKKATHSVLRSTLKLHKSTLSLFNKRKDQQHDESVLAKKAKNTHKLENKLKRIQDRIEALKNLNVDKVAEELFNYQLNEILKSTKKDKDDGTQVEAKNEQTETTTTIAPDKLDENDPNQWTKKQIIESKEYKEKLQTVSQKLLKLYDLNKKEDKPKKTKKRKQTETDTKQNEAESSDEDSSDEEDEDSDDGESEEEESKVNKVNNKKQRFNDAIFVDSLKAASQSRKRKRNKKQKDEVLDKILNKKKNRMGQRQRKRLAQEREMRERKRRKAEKKRHESEGTKESKQVGTLVTEESVHLHPSWKAKQAQKQKQTKAFQGTRIVFDD